MFRKRENGRSSSRSVTIHQSLHPCASLNHLTPVQQSLSRGSTGARTNVSSAGQESVRGSGESTEGSSGPTCARPSAMQLDANK